MHRAAQYLATAAKSFIPPKPDDSHTNLGWDPQSRSISTHGLNDQGLILSLQLSNFQLQWIQINSILETLDLDGQTHREIKGWLSKSAVEIGLSSPYKYELHYEIPYMLTNDYQFQKPDDKEIDGLIAVRTLALEAMNHAAVELGYDLTPRIWPHHFDTGYLIEMDEGRAIGVGMGIPDRLIDDFYFYVSGYQGHAYIDNKDMPEPSIGQKYTDWWKGYAVAASGMSEQLTSQFLLESIQIYQD